jgi:hypothetical protein
VFQFEDGLENSLYIFIVAYLPKARILKPAETGNAREQLQGHISLAMREHAVMEAVFSVVHAEDITWTACHYKTVLRWKLEE